MRSLQACKVVTSLLEHTLRIGYELSRDRAAEPKAPSLITRQAARSSLQGLYVSTANTAVPTCRHECEVAAIAQVDYVLTGRAQDPCGLARRQQLVSVRAHHGIDRPSSHRGSRVTD